MCLYEFVIIINDTYVSIHDCQNNFFKLTVRGTNDEGEQFFLLTAATKTDVSPNCRKQDICNK